MPPKGSVLHKSGIGVVQAIWGATNERLQTLMQHGSCVHYTDLREDVNRKTEHLDMFLGGEKERCTGWQFICGTPSAYRGFWGWLSGVRFATPGFGIQCLRHRWCVKTHPTGCVTLTFLRFGRLVMEDLDHGHPSRCELWVVSFEQ